ncbi:MAG: thiamine pyrophosphate-dependent enzyme, partial [Acidimicrobiales bacterium]
VIVVLLDNQGFQSIGALSESVGAERLGTRYRYRGATGALDGDRLPVDLAANAASLGAHVIRATTLDELRAALAAARAHPSVTVVHVETDPFDAAPDSASWWDVPVAEVASRASTRDALARYSAERAAQRSFLRPSTLAPTDRA